MIISNIPRPTNPRPSSDTWGNKRSLPSQPILFTGVTIAAVPEPKNSVTFPSEYHDNSCEIVIGSSRGYILRLDGTPGSVISPEV